MNLALLFKMEYFIFSIFKKYITYHVTHPGKMGAFRVVGVPVVLYTLVAPFMLLNSTPKTRKKYDKVDH